MPSNLTISYYYCYYFLKYSNLVHWKHLENIQINLTYEIHLFSLLFRGNFNIYSIYLLTDHYLLLSCQIFLNGTSMARVHIRPRDPTVTCTSSQPAFSGIHSPLTLTNWSSVRSSNTTAYLLVHFHLSGHVLQLYSVTLFSEMRANKLCWFLYLLCRN